MKNEEFVSACIVIHYNKLLSEVIHFPCGNYSTKQSYYTQDSNVCLLNNDVLKIQCSSAQLTMITRPYNASPQGSTLIKMVDSLAESGYDYKFVNASVLMTAKTLKY